MTSVLKPWVEQLGLRYQGVLMSCVRGCDSVEKNDASKNLARCLRSIVLNSFNENPSSFIENVNDIELQERMVAVLKNHDHYPIHYILHIIHSAEIIGYKHPNENIRNQWYWFYREFVHKFHMSPETERQLSYRLEADESSFANQQSIDKEIWGQ